MESSIAVLPGPRVSFLDHLAPLCAHFKVPLHCTDPWVITCAEQFYPNLEIVTGDLSSYNNFYTVEPCRIHRDLIKFGDTLIRGKVKTIAGFHGNPDKFRTRFWIERYADEDVVLIYGQHLIDYLKEKGVWHRLKNTISIGNLRYAYYKEHQTFFDTAIKPHLLFEKKKPILFWAPTWSFTSSCDDSPFFALYAAIFEALPDAYQMVVKLHPFMFHLHPEKITHIIESYSHIHFIGEIPLVYPILNQADIYIGDYSSVAYDFLVFDRPLFFLGERTQPWGVKITDPKRLFHEIEKPDRLSKARKAAYAYVYGEE